MCIRGHQNSSLWVQGGIKISSLWVQKLNTRLYRYRESLNVIFMGSRGHQDSSLWVQGGIKTCLYGYNRAINIIFIGTRSIKTHRNGSWGGQNLNSKLSWSKSNGLDPPPEKNSHQPLLLYMETQTTDVPSLFRLPSHWWRGDRCVRRWHHLYSYCDLETPSATSRIWVRAVWWTL